MHREAQEFIWEAQGNDSLTMFTGTQSILEAHDTANSQLSYPLHKNLAVLVR